MHTKNIIRAGKELSEASKAMIFLHGRGGNAQDFLDLAHNFPVKDFALFAPQATNNTWYPYSFLVPPTQNEPGLSSALQILKDLLEEINSSGISSQDIYFAGFSQGACLTAEFVTRNAMKFGGIIIFTGGLIGDIIYPENYNGDFAGTPVFIGTGNPDVHVPLERVEETERIMKQRGAYVMLKIYNNRPHSISSDEIQNANLHIFKREPEDF